MGQHGHRNMFYATGLPGWMRFGYSPGWGGMPPCAQYLERTERLSEAVDWFNQQTDVQPNQTIQADVSYSPASQSRSSEQTSADQGIQELEGRLNALKDRIEQIREKLEQLKE